jgi:hypothetical protein
VKVISAIVLLLWAVCYGRCLTDQYGETEAPVRTWCEHQCCQSEQPLVPPTTPETSCGICEFLKSGIVLPSDGIHLEVPHFSLDSGIEPARLNERDWSWVEEGGNVTVSFAAPPPVGRLCEWMARTASPVRGPNA